MNIGRATPCMVAVKDKVIRNIIRLKRKENELKLSFQLEKTALVVSMSTL